MRILVYLAEYFMNIILLGWLKSLFWFFHKMLHKKTNFLAEPIVICSSN